MKSFRNLLLESLNISKGSMISEGEISSEKEFREYAKKKFEEVFGDELDEDKMNNIVNGILKKYKKDGDWGKLVGILNKSF